MSASRRGSRPETLALAHRHSDLSRSAPSSSHFDQNGFADVEQLEKAQSAQPGSVQHTPHSVNLRDVAAGRLCLWSAQQASCTAPDFVSPTVAPELLRPGVLFRSSQIVAAAELSEMGLKVEEAIHAHAF